MTTEKRNIEANTLREEISSLRATVIGLRACKGVLNECMKQYRESVLRIIDEQPTVDAVEVVHGRWREKILVGGFAEEWGYVCSECGCTVSDRSKLGIGKYASNNQRLNYCPNCCAKMDGDGNG